MERETETTAAILAVVRDVLGRPDIGADEDVFDHGASSLSFVRILAHVYQQFGVMVPTTELGGVATARAIAALVASGQADRSVPTSIGV